MLHNDKMFNIVDEVSILTMQIQRGLYTNNIAEYFRYRVPGITEDEIAAICEVLYPLQARVQKHIKDHGRPRA